MIGTDELIDTLARDVPAVSPNFARGRIAVALAAGGLTTLVLVATLLGVRPDLDIAMAGPMFWLKVGYGGSLALVALLAASVLSRPEARPPRWTRAAVVPVAVLATVAMVEMASAPSNHRIAMWLGDSWQECPFLVGALSLPILLALFAAFRRLAPTRLQLTGGLLGLAAGALAATIYCLHCPESSAAFVLTWYSLGIVFAMIAGIILGPRLLRW